MSTPTPPKPVEPAVEPQRSRGITILVVLLLAAAVLLLFLRSTIADRIADWRTARDESSNAPAFVPVAPAVTTPTPSPTPTPTVVAAAPVTAGTNLPKSGPEMLPMALGLAGTLGAGVAAARSAASKRQLRTRRTNLHLG